MKTSSNVPGHITKISSRPIYGKNLPKSPSVEPRGRLPWNLVYSIEASSTTKCVQMMTLDLPWPFLWHSQICFVMLLLWWKLIQHIVMYFQGCSNSAYPMHSGERYRTIVLLFLLKFTLFLSWTLDIPWLYLEAIKRIQFFWCWILGIM